MLGYTCSEYCYSISHLFTTTYNRKYIIKYSDTGKDARNCLCRWFNILKILKIVLLMGMKYSYTKKCVIVHISLKNF